MASLVSIYKIKKGATKCPLSYINQLNYLRATAFFAVE